MEQERKLVTFGETMIRLSPPDHHRLEQTSLLDVNVGSSELNVAVTAQRLWSQKRARAVMTKLVNAADILITTEEDTERETPSVWRNTWTAIVYADRKIYRGPKFDIEVVDRVGAGDSFAGGFLFGYLDDGPAAGVRYGIAISALKQTNPGDLCWASLEEVERLLEGGGLRIVR